MTKLAPWFVEERAVAFASLMLTSRHNVIVKAPPNLDKVLDLLVEVLKDGKSTLRFFGVQLIADLDLPNIQNSNDPVHSHLLNGASEAAFPLCIFAIGVRKPEGLFCWVVEPVVENGQAILQRDGEAKWQTLDETGTARLIGQVNAWYDALNGVLAQKGRARHSKTKS